MSRKCAVCGKEIKKLGTYINKNGNIAFCCRDCETKKMIEFLNKDKMNDGEIINVFIESTLIQLCNDIREGERLATKFGFEILKRSMEHMNKLSQIYKNMGFDKEDKRE